MDSLGLTAGGPAVVGYDCTGANLAKVLPLIPPGAQLAGYATGSGGVPWSAAQWAAHPAAVRIDQDPAASDPTADVLDVEFGAATPADCPGWVRRAQADYARGARPGQRWPAIYFSASNVHIVADALVRGGVTSGAGFWIADWNFTSAQAFADVLNASGPFPIVAVQYRDPGLYDVDVFSAAWLGNTSGSGPYRHITGHMATFGALARSRHATVEGFVGRAFHGYTQADWDALDAVNVGKGFPYFTQRP